MTELKRIDFDGRAGTEEDPIKETRGKRGVRKGLTAKDKSPNSENTTFRPLRVKHNIWLELRYLAKLQERTMRSVVEEAFWRYCMSYREREYLERPREHRSMHGVYVRNDIFEAMKKVIEFKGFKWIELYEQALLHYLVDNKRVKITGDSNVGDTEHHQGMS